ncbi:MAG: PHP domain-containing protein [Ruminococcaceae bacterium]|nr:PHP domain-containing protein [Oscillospiraceae bacterium]
MVDLHTHTTNSDGSLTPRELVKLAKEQGFSAIAVTDHDTVDGVFEAMQAGNEFGIETIPGIELSCNYERELHIIGLFIDPNYPPLVEKLKELAKNREKRNQKTLEILNSLGMPITVEEVKQIATGNIWGRAHFAKLLCDKGYVASVKEGFQKYLGHGRVAHVNEDRIEPEDAISLIRAAGGVPILAHMHYLKLSEEDLRNLLIRFQKSGLAGAEVIYTEYTPEQTKLYTELVEELGLLKSGGSDFHGAMKPQIPLTPNHLRIPYSFLKEIKNHVRTF